MEERVQHFEHLMSKAVLTCCSSHAVRQTPNQTDGLCTRPKPSVLGRKKKELISEVGPPCATEPVSAPSPADLNDETQGQSQLLNSHPREALISRGPWKLLLRFPRTGSTFNYMWKEGIGVCTLEEPQR